MRANSRITEGFDAEDPLAVAVLSVRQLDARCRMWAGGQTVTLRLLQHWDAVPGEIVLVAPRRRWRLAGTLRLSGTLISTRIEAIALGLTPLRLQKTGM